MIFNHGWNNNGFSSEIYERIIRKYPGKVFYDQGLLNSNKRELEGAIPISINLDEMVSFAEYAGTVIACRSGIVDVLSSAKIELFSLYETPLPLNKYEYAEKLCAGSHWFLERLGMAPYGFEKRVYISKCESNAANALHLLNKIEHELEV